MYIRVISIKEDYLYSLKIGDICYINYDVYCYSDDGKPYYMMMDKNREETIFIHNIKEYFEDFSEYRNKRIEEIFE